MNPFLRQGRDGRRVLGYGFYFLAGLTACAGIFLLQRQAGPGEGGVARVRRGKSSDVEPITQAAALMSRVEIKNKPPPPETRSYRLEDASPAPRPPAAASFPPAFDAIGAALQAAPPEPDPAAVSRPLDEAGDGRVRPPAPAYPELPPAFEAGPARPGASASPELLGYRDFAADAAAAEPVAGASRDDPERAEFLIPRGTLICAYLLTTVDTSNPAAVLQFGAARTLVFHRRPQLPFGTRFLGKLAGPPARDRLNLAIDTVLFPEGGEIPIAASAVEADEQGENLRPGLAADYFPPPAWAQLAPYVSDFATGALGLLESRAQRQFAVGLGGALTAGAIDSLRPPLYQASGQAIQDFTQARLKEISQRYASHFLIPAGTACWLELEADLDLSSVRGPRFLRSSDAARP